MPVLRKLVLIILGLSLCVAEAAAQSSNATLSGFVRDASGAFISNANITVEALATHLKYTSRTGDSGAYKVVDLPVGDYTVTTVANGFKQSIAPKVTLQTAQAADLDITMALGAVSEQVTVTTTVPVINTQESSIGQVVEN